MLTLRGDREEDEEEEEAEDEMTARSERASESRNGQASQQSFIFNFPSRYEMNVPNDVIGAVIGKRGAKINEIRTLSGASINIMEVGARGGQRSRDRSPDPERERVIEISGSTHAVTMAKSLITIAMDLGDGAQARGGRDGERRGGGGGRFDRTRSRSRDRGSYDDRRGRRDKFAPF